MKIINYHKKSIRVKYLNGHYIADDGNGNRKRVSCYEFSGDEKYAHAAKELCKKMGWLDDNLVMSSYKNDKIFTFIPKEKLRFVYTVGEAKHQGYGNYTQDLHLYQIEENNPEPVFLVMSPHARGNEAKEVYRLIKESNLLDEAVFDKYKNMPDLKCSGVCSIYQI